MNWYKLQKQARGTWFTTMDQPQDSNYNPYAAIYGNPGLGSDQGQNKSRLPDTGHGGRPYTKKNKPPKYSELPENHMDWENLPNDLPSSDHEFVDAPDSDMGEKRPNVNRQGVNDGTFYDPDSPLSTVQQMNNADKGLDSKPGVHNMPANSGHGTGNKGIFEKARKLLKKHPKRR